MQTRKQSIYKTIIYLYPITMNPTKQKILRGQEVLRRDEQHLVDINNASDFSGLQNALRALYEERVHNVKSRIAKLNDQFAVEFEKESAEANTRMPAVLENAKKYINREPKAVADKIKAIVDKYNEPHASKDQEETNDDFYDLIDHIKFMNNNGKSASPVPMKATSTAKK